VHQHVGVVAPGQLLGDRLALGDRHAHDALVEAQLRQVGAVDLGDHAEAVQRRDGVRGAVQDAGGLAEQQHAVAHPGQLLERVLAAGERELAQRHHPGEPAERAEVRLLQIAVPAAAPR
jgi:hypothetical protein